MVSFETVWNADFSRGFFFLIPRKKVEMEMKIIAVHTVPHKSITPNKQGGMSMDGEPPTKEGSPRALGGSIQAHDCMTGSATRSCERNLYTRYTCASHDPGV